jgi:hypothetical protein
MFNVDIYYFQVRMSRFYSRREKVVDEFYEKEMKYYRTDFDLYVKRNWIYHGGNMGTHLEYYHIINPNTPVPSEEEQDFCICGRYLRKERYYLKKITHYKKGNLSLSEKYMLIVGKCCIQPYLKELKLNTL